MDLDIKSPNLAVESLPLCFQLGADYSGAMGLTGCSRILDRAYPKLLLGQAESRNLALRRGACQDLTESQGASGQGCHCGNPVLHSQLHILDLPGISHILYATMNEHMAAYILRITEMTSF